MLRMLVKDKNPEILFVLYLFVWLDIRIGIPFKEKKDWQKTRGDILLIRKSFSIFLFFFNQLNLFSSFFG